MRTLKSAVTSKQLKGTPLEGPCEAIQEIPDCSDSEVPKERSKGRAAVKRTPKKVIQTDSRPERCRCGGNLISVAKLRSEFTNFDNRLTKLEAIKGIEDILICPECGEAFVQTNSDGDHSFLPNRNESLNTMISMANAVGSGVPLNRVLGREWQKQHLGHSTPYKHLLEFDEKILDPIAKAIREAFKTAPYIVAEETRFHVVQDTKNKHGEIIETKDKRGFHVLACTTAGKTEHPLTCYTYINGRSIKEIRDVITPDFQFKGLITDGHAAYDAIAKEHPNARHQICLLHMRRYILRSLQIPELLDDREILRPDKIKKLIENDIGKGGALTGMLHALLAIEKIYLYRKRMLNPDPEDRTPPERYLEYQRTAMDSIDSIFVKLAEGRLSLIPGQKAKAIRKDVFNAPLEYYFNHRQGLRAFLKDPNLSPDSNEVERRIRPIAVLRNNVVVAQTPAGLKTMLDIYTIWTTLRDNGIEDPGEWVREQAHRYYCSLLNRAVTEHYREDPPDLTASAKECSAKAFEKEIIKELEKGMEVKLPF